MSARAESSAGRVERWLTGPFKREGWRGVVRRFLRGAIVLSLAWGFISIVIGGLAGRMSVKELVWAETINSSAILMAMAVLWWIASRDVATFETWDAADRPPAEADRVLRLVLTSPARWVTWGIATYSVLAFPAFYVLVVATAGSHAFAILLCVAGFLSSTVLVWPVGVFVGELSTRPVIARVSAEFPEVAAPEGHGMSLRTRALLPVPAVTLTTGISAGALAGRFDLPFGQVGSAIVLSLVYTVLIAALLRVAVTEAALRPIDDVIDGVVRISRGDLGSRVPITGGDELAVLGRAVNEMTDRLASHDAEMRASRARIVAASDEARRNVERDLHDGAQQYLVLLELKLGLLTKKVSDDPEASELAAEIRTDLAQALAELRDLAHGIYPAVLESDGLPGALQAAAERSSIPVSVDSDGVGRYAQELEAAVYFCCLEALQNAAKHAGDDAKAAVRLSQADGRVEFEVADDGAGYDVDSIGPSAGLQNMADRIGALGGEVQIESTPGQGTTVRGRVPVGST
jgi:signal transduction histidine kinase